MSGQGQVKGQNWAFQHFGSQNRQLDSNRPKFGRNTLNPRTAGGAVIRPPLRFFADSGKTAARSAAKFAIAVQPTIWHISKKTMTRWHQRSRLQVTLSDLTSSCVFRSLTSCQRHTSDPNSLKLAVYSKDVGVYNLYISDFWYRWP